MAQGQTTRNNLSLHNTDDAATSFRDIQRWANRLPIASSGFHAYATANEVFNAAAARNMILDTMLYNREKWQTAGSTTSFTVPPGLSGVYVLNAGVFWSVNTAQVYVVIDVNTVAIAQSPTSTLAAGPTISYAAGTYPLKERDIVSLRFINNSAGAITSTVSAANAGTPQLPFLSAWRISLL